jgi:hypothetical protein
LSVTPDSNHTGTSNTDGEIFSVTLNYVIFEKALSWMFNIKYVMKLYTNE